MSITVIANLLPPIVMAVMASAAWAGSTLQLVGYSGSLGEWEWSAVVTEQITGRSKEFSGPVTMQHVGVCTQDGPETKTGQIRLQLSKLPSEMKATIWVDGVECQFAGRLSDRYTGSMTCPDRPAMPLVIWLR